MGFLSSLVLHTENHTSLPPWPCDLLWPMYLNKVTLSHFMREYLIAGAQSSASFLSLETLKLPHVRSPLFYFSLKRRKDNNMKDLSLCNWNCTRSITCVIAFLNAAGITIFF